MGHAPLTIAGIILFAFLSGCTSPDHPAIGESSTQPGSEPENHPQTTNAGGGSSAEDPPANVAKNSTTANPFRLNAAGCSGVAFVMEMPTELGFPFPSPPGWASETGVYLDLYWSYLLSCDRIVMPDTSVHLNAFIGWDGHTNFSLQGRSVEGQWDTFLSIMNFYGSPQLEGRFGETQADFVSIDGMERVVEQEGLISFRWLTDMGVIEISEHRAPIFNSPSQRSSYTDKWLVDFEIEKIATVELSESISGASYSGTIKVPANHELARWPIQSDQGMIPRSLVEIVDASVGAREDE